MQPFISEAPRPYTKLSLIVALKGGVCQFSAGPLGTTSVCPAKTNKGPEKAWEKIFNQIDKYSRLFEKNKLKLRAFHLELFEKFLELQTGDLRTTVSAMKKNCYPNLKEPTIRRHVLRAANLLDGTEKLDQTGKKSARTRRTEEALSLRIFIEHHPDLWGEGFTKRQKEIVFFFYFDRDNDPEMKRTQDEVAKIIGVDYSTVSRDLVRIKNQREKLTGKY